MPAAASRIAVILTRLYCAFLVRIAQPGFLDFLSPLFTEIGIVSEKSSRSLWKRLHYGANIIFYLVTIHAVHYLFLYWYPYVQRNLELLLSLDYVETILAMSGDHGRETTIRRDSGRRTGFEFAAGMCTSEPH